MLCWNDWYPFGEAPDHVFAAVIESTPPEAFLRKAQGGETFLHALVRRDGVNLSRLSQVIATAPRELLTITDSRGRTAHDVAERSSHLPKGARAMLLPSVKGAGC